MPIYITITPYALSIDFLQFIQSDILQLIVPQPVCMLHSVITHLINHSINQSIRQVGWSDIRCQNCLCVKKNTQPNIVYTEMKTTTKEARWSSNARPINLLNARTRSHKKITRFISKILWDRKWLDITYLQVGTICVNK